MPCREWGHMAGVTLTLVVHLLCTPGGVWAAPTCEQGEASVCWPQLSLQGWGPGSRPGFDLNCHAVLGEGEVQLVPLVREATDAHSRHPGQTYGVEGHASAGDPGGREAVHSRAGGVGGGLLWARHALT